MAPAALTNIDCGSWNGILIGWAKRYVPGLALSDKIDLTSAESRSLRQLRPGWYTCIYNKLGGLMTSLL